MENQQQNIFNDGPQQNLPNATAVLVLGIISIVGCFCYGIVGLVCGIIAIVLAKKDNRLYMVNPSMYKPSSYSNLKAGRICAIIGVVVSALTILFYVIVIAMVGMSGLMNPAIWSQLGK
ncbi:MAG: rane protein [Flavipsychrobacter sp.]|jgi:hypothetical protein|nr:rane protein [Flavipsychrobacter sp.]